MTFKLPDGELRWLCLAWLVLGIAGGIALLVLGRTVMGASVLMAGLLALGICLQQRWCAWLLLALYTVSAVVILTREVILAREYARLAKVALNAWFSYALFDWLRRTQNDSNPGSGSGSGSTGAD